MVRQRQLWPVMCNPGISALFLATIHDGFTISTFETCAKTRAAGNTKSQEEYGRYTCMILLCAAVFV